ncbi:MAG: DUF488 family protein [Pseudomonadota bacterium]|jgi:uncharacterized protein YeaO (DUF488 family)
MSLRIVQLGSQRKDNEGLRIGTVRRPPRGVAKENFSSQNWYDVWYPALAPSAETMKLGQQATDEAAWQTFEKHFRREMKQTEPARTLELLAKLSHTAQFSMGCYCDNEARCHRSILRSLLTEHGALFAPD